LKTTSRQAQDRAEAAFRKKQIQMVEGQKAMAEYVAERQVVRDRTARLRAQRLQREAAESTDNERGAG